MRRASNRRSPRTMTVRLVADIQNRLFWRIGIGRASECCVPLCGPGARHPEIGSDVRAEQRLQGLSLGVAPDRVVLIAANPPSQQKGQISHLLRTNVGLADGFTAMVIGGWSRSREIFGACGWAAGGGYPFCGGAFGVRAGLRVGWMVAGCP